MNSLTLVGNLTVDPKLKTVSIGNVPTKVVNFSIAMNEQGRDEPTYFRVHAWRGLAETCAKYLKKGRKVMVVGPVHIKSYKGNCAMEVRAEKIEFLDKKPEETITDELETLDEAEMVSPETVSEPVEDSIPSEDDLPF